MESSLLVILRRHSFGPMSAAAIAESNQGDYTKAFIRQFSWRFLGSFSTLAMMLKKPKARTCY